MKQLKQLYTDIRKAFKRFADNRYIAKLLLDVDESKRPTFERLLRNELEYIDTMPTHQKLLTQRDALMLITKRVIEQIYVLTGVVGVQPMSGPVDLVYMLRQSTEAGQMKLEMVKDSVMAGTRKLQARWPLEAAQDLKTTHGIDIADVIASALAGEIATEIIQEVVSNLYAIGERNAATVNTDNAVYVGDNIGALAVNINMQANNIARDTRRGAGNFIILSPVGAAVLSSFKFAGMKYEPTKNTKAKTFSLDYTGNLVTEDGKIMYRIYTTILMPVDEANETYIVGYKGDNGECDTGYIFSPYVICMLSGVTVDPTTHQQAMGVMLRSGKWVANSDDGGADSSAYFKNVKCSLFEKQLLNE